MPVVAFLNVGPPDARRDRVVAFLKGLSETGYVEGRNVAVEYYWLDANYKNLPAVLDLVIRRDVAVIAVPGATPASLERRFWAGTFLPTPMPRRSTRGRHLAEDLHRGFAAANANSPSDNSVGLRRIWQLLALSGHRGRRRSRCRARADPEAAELLGVALEPRRRLVTDVTEPHRIELVQRRHLAARIPPFRGERSTSADRRSMLFNSCQRR